MKLKDALSHKYARLAAISVPLSAMTILRPQETYAIFETLNKAGIPIGSIIAILSVLIAIRFDLHRTLKASIDSLSKELSLSLKEATGAILQKLKEGDDRFHAIESDVDSLKNEVETIKNDLQKGILK